MHGRRACGRIRPGAIARERGRTLLTLDTAADEGAGPFYEKLGFVKAGVIPDYALEATRWAVRHDHLLEAHRRDLISRTAMPTFATVDEYIAAQSAEVQPRLRELREIFRAALPDAAEVISYGLPTYKFGAGFVYFGAAKRHCAIYGSSTVALAEELRGFRQAKGTVRFPLDQPVPAELVRKLIVATVAEREAAHKR